MMYAYIIHLVYIKGREMPVIGRSGDRLRHVLSPLYMQLFNLIGQLEGRVKFLVDLRSDLLVSCICIVHTYNKYIHIIIVIIVLYM